jgi:hypothetical protein
MDLTQAKRLIENAGVSFIGPQKNGPFNIPGDKARDWLTSPNPHGKGNKEVVRPWVNGMDITRRPSDTWIVDFGGEITEADAMLFDNPFTYVVENIKPERVSNNRAARAKYWWRHGEIMPAMRASLSKLPRFIGTARVAKHRMFLWLARPVLPDCQVVVVARSDDTTFGILQSRFHELWSLGLCTWLGKGNDPRYTPTTTFETFPFPDGLTPADTKGPTEALDSGAVLPTVAADQRAVAIKIAEAAHRLNELRETWLNPPAWVDRVPEVVSGYPDRIIPKPGREDDLKKLTLTNLYNKPPTWLTYTHQILDAAVAAAYGWTNYTAEMSDEEILRRLLALNLQRPVQGEAQKPTQPRPD